MRQDEDGYQDDPGHYLGEAVAIREPMPQFFGGWSWEIYMG